MSDIAYDVEGGTPPPETPAPEPQQPPPASALQTPPAAQSAPPEPEETTEVGGQKMVPLAALQAEREQNRTLKDKAQRFDEVSGWYAQNKPYVDFLQAHPDLLQPQPPAPRAAPSPAPQPEHDEALVGLARTLDLYTPEGKPDAQRASVIRNLVQSEAQSIAREAIKPLEQMTVREKAAQNYRDALNVTLPDGSKPNPRILAEIWRGGNQDFLATTEGAALAVFTAAGMGAFAGQPATQIAPATQTLPVVTEPSGGRSPNRPAISEFEQRVIQMRGIPAAKHQEYTRNFRVGETNALETD